MPGPRRDRPPSNGQYPGPYPSAQYPPPEYSWPHDPFLQNDSHRGGDEPAQYGQAAYQPFGQAPAPGRQYPAPPPGPPPSQWHTEAPMPWPDGAQQAPRQTSGRRPRRRTWLIPVATAVVGFVAGATVQNGQTPTLTAAEAAAGVPATPVTVTRTLNPTPGPTPSSSSPSAASTSPSPATASATPTVTSSAVKAPFAAPAPSGAAPGSAAPSSAAPQKPARTTAPKNTSKSKTTAKAKPTKKTTKKPTKKPAKSATRKATKPPAKTSGSVYYANCSAVRSAGAAPLYRGEPGYRSALDRDGDGVACE